MWGGEWLEIWTFYLWMREWCTKNHIRAPSINKCSQSQNEGTTILPTVLQILRSILKYRCRRRFFKLSLKVGSWENDGAAVKRTVLRLSNSNKCTYIFDVKVSVRTSLTSWHQVVVLFSRKIITSLNRSVSVF